jgi:hypothetical protein
MLAWSTSRDVGNETDLANVTELTAVAAERDTTVLNVSGRSKALDVLSRVLGPTLRHLDTARLRGDLDGENVLTIRIADEVNDCHVRGDLLLLGDKKNTEIVLAKGFLNGRKIELVDSSASVGAKADTECVEILLLGSVDEGRPSRLGVHLRNASPVDDATGLAVDSAVALFLAELAGAVERTLDALVGAISLVVTDLTAVVALAVHTAAALGLVRAIASEVAGLLADTACAIISVAAAVAA